MLRRLTWSAGVAALLALAPWALAAEESSPVPKPEIKVGEWWTYRATEYATNVPRVFNHHVNVTFVGPNEVLTVDRTDRDSIWTPEWSALTLGGPGVTYDKPRRLLNFPLKIGTSHQISYEVVARRGSGARSRYQDTVKVVGWEEVVVPAGTFRALKVEVTGNYQRLDARFGGWVRQDIWYVPEVKRWVKWTYVEGTGAPNPGVPKNVDELIQFRVEK